MTSTRNEERPVSTRLWEDYCDSERRIAERNAAKLANSYLLPNGVIKPPRPTAEQRAEEDEQLRRRVVQRSLQPLVDQIVAEGKRHPAVFEIKQRAAKLREAITKAEADHTQAMAEFETASASVAEVMASGGDFAAVEKRRDKAAGTSVQLATRLSDLRAALVRVTAEIEPAEIAAGQLAAKARMPEASQAGDAVRQEMEQLRERHAQELAELEPRYFEATIYEATLDYETIGSENADPKFAPVSVPVVEGK